LTNPDSDVAQHERAGVREDSKQIVMVSL